METLALSANTRQCSFNAVKSMIDDFDLESPDGTAEFEAELDFLVRGKRKVSRSNIRIIRDKENYIITLLDRTINSSLVPVEFKTGIQTFIYFVNEYLFIAGFNPNPSIGDYTLSISPVTH